jgi:alpha-glucosidase (family GH31 glycosyl hydrolase)
MAGFPFLMPGPIGGDFKRIRSSPPDPDLNLRSNENETETESESRDEPEFPLSFFERNKPDRDLYIRWLQLAHFLPIVQYQYLPSDYDPQVMEIARNLKVIRQTKLYYFIRRAINNALTTGLPVIRPLWMIDPQDVNCLRIWDQFLIGDRVIVAPLLYKNVTERDIYLPKGRWKDEMDGSSMKGERWVHHYRGRNQIPFFTLLDDPPSSA